MEGNGNGQGAAQASWLKRLRFGPTKRGNLAAYVELPDIGEVTVLPVTNFSPKEETWYDCEIRPTRRGIVFRALATIRPQLPEEERPDKLICAGRDLKVLADETRVEDGRKRRFVLYKLGERGPVVFLEQGVAPLTKSDAEKQFELETSIGLHYVLKGPIDPVAVWQNFFRRTRIAGQEVALKLAKAIMAEAAGALPGDLHGQWLRFKDEAWLRTLIDTAYQQAGLAEKVNDRIRQTFVTAIKKLPVTGYKLVSSEDQGPLSVFSVSYIRIADDGKVGEMEKVLPEVLLGFIEQDTIDKLRRQIEREVTKEGNASLRDRDEEVGRRLHELIRTKRTDAIHAEVLTPTTISRKASLLYRQLHKWHDDVRDQQTQLRVWQRDRIGRVLPLVLNGIEVAERALTNFYHSVTAMENLAEMAARGEAIKAATLAEERAKAAAVKPTEVKVEQPVVVVKPVEPEPEDKLSEREIKALKKAWWPVFGGVSGIEANAAAMRMATGFKKHPDLLAGDDAAVAQVIFNFIRDIAADSLDLPMLVENLRRVQGIQPEPIRKSGNGKKKAVKQGVLQQLGNELLEHVRASAAIPDNRHGSAVGGLVLALEGGSLEELPTDEAEAMAMLARAGLKPNERQKFLAYVRRLQAPTEEEPVETPVLEPAKPKPTKEAWVDWLTRQKIAPKADRAVRAEALLKATSNTPQDLVGVEESLLLETIRGAIPDDGTMATRIVNAIRKG